MVTISQNMFVRFVTLIHNTEREKVKNRGSIVCKP